MLVLKRKEGESLLIGDNVEIKIIEIDEGRIKIGIEAPREITILRKEVLDETRAENKEAASSKTDEVREKVKDMLKK